MPRLSIRDRKECGLSESQLIHQVQEFLRQRSQHQRPSRDLLTAWRQFYREYNPMIDRIVSRYLPGRADREDCVQHFWLSLLAILPRLRFDPERGTLRGWLSKVTHRLTCTYARERNRRASRFAVHVPEWEKTVTIKVAGPLERLQQGEQITLVHRVLGQLRNRLSLPTYRVFYLRWMEGQSFEEIGDRLDLTSHQVRWRHHRAKRKAAELLMRDADRCGKATGLHRNALGESANQESRQISANACNADRIRGQFDQYCEIGAATPGHLERPQESQ